MTGLVYTHEPTTLTSILHHGTVTSHTWYTYLSSSLSSLYIISQVGVFLGYILHHTREEAVKVDHVIKLVLWQVVLLPLSKTFPLVSFLAAFAVVYGLYGLRKGEATTLFIATAYNAFQRLAWSLALVWVIFSCTKV